MYLLTSIKHAWHLRVLNFFPEGTPTHPLFCSFQNTSCIHGTQGLKIFLKNAAESKQRKSAVLLAGY